MPALLQNEVHPYHQNKDMVEHIARVGTVMESWFPLGGKDSTMWGSDKNKETLFHDPVIAAIAKAHGKTPAQVILRWHLQEGYVAIPGSSREDHIRENFDIFDFELTPEEMAQFASLERNERFAGY